MKNTAFSGSFDFNPTEKGRRYVRNELCKSLAKRGGRSTKSIKQALAGTNFPGEFQKAFQDLGLRETNVVDITTAYWMVMWTVMKQGPWPPIVGPKAVLEQVEQYLAGNKMLGTEDQRRMIGETLVCETVLALHTYTDAKAQNDLQQLTTLANNARQNMATRGMPLDHMELTQDGFQKPAGPHAGEASANSS